MKYKVMTGEEISSFISNGETIGISGFTPSGDPKVIPSAIAKKAEKLHKEGKEFKINLLTGASTGDLADGVLARANAIKKRMPYQSNTDLRNKINSGEVDFADQHLSMLPQNTRYGFYGDIDTAIVEAIEVTDDGKIYLSTSGGASATYLTKAKKIFIEINKTVPEGIKEMQDVYIPKMPPNREPIPIINVSDRIGDKYVQVDSNKIKGIIYSDIPNNAGELRTPGVEETAIANNVMDFLVYEMKKGRLPQGLPYQSGVGNVANAVLSCFSKSKDIKEPIKLYTEVAQDSLFQLVEADRLDIVSTSSLTLSSKGLEKIGKDIEYYKNKVIIRQQEISNNPEVIRRLGVIAMNTALEADIFGNINSTNVMGIRMMNGIGGSGDFCRNGFLSIFMTPSIAKGEDISTIVPMVSHTDHNEHSVQILVTEQGLADLRGKSPRERVEAIIENCAHPNYRPMLREYLKLGLTNKFKHTPMSLDKSFEFHKRFMDTGSMKK